MNKDFILIPLFSICAISCFFWSIQPIAPKSAKTTHTTATHIHFLIPGGAGGGWDSTARGVAEALRKSGIQKSTSFENMSGGGGGKAIAHLIETASHQKRTLMINSTPIVTRSLQKIFSQSFRDLTPVAAVIGDYGAFVVPIDSKYQNWLEVIKDFKKDARLVKIAGGSMRGSTDHLVAALAFKAAGVSPDKVIYVPYDAGGKAMAGLLSRETQILSTGLSEALDLQRAGEVRILAITAAKRLTDLPKIPTLKEFGYNVNFVNWRGFFAAPGISLKKIKQYNQIFQKMYKTKEWEQIRSRNGWVNIYKPGPKEFSSFLEKQEKQLGDLMRDLGFLE